MECEATRFNNFQQTSAIIYDLLLLRLPDVGPKRYWQMCSYFGSAKNVFQTDIAQLNEKLPRGICEAISQIQQRGKNHKLWEDIESEIAWCLENRISILSPGCPDYPSLLLETDSPPPVLFVRGQIANLRLPQLALVGSRNPTPSGKENAFQFSKKLCESGFAISSGLAAGVDGAAHQGALVAAGITIGVMGTGIDQIYPKRHQNLAEEIIAQGGTLLTEFPRGAPPHASHFPRRNRIISALSLGVLVVEAAVKSGSLITARYAMQQGREVFAIPGSIHNPLSRGCHALIKDGATLVESVDDMREPLQGLLTWHWQASENQELQTPAMQQKLSNQEALVYTSVGYETANIDKLTLRTQLPVGEILSLLIGLELKGLIAQTPGGYQRC